MAKTLQFRRGTTSEINALTGAVGELFVDTTKNTVVVQDGSTAGGIPLAKESALTTGLAAKADASALTSGLAGKQNTLVSGTSIKTVNGNSLLGSGDITITGGASFPTQTGHLGQFLTTDGTNVSWAAVSGGSGGSLTAVSSDVLPIFSGVYDIGNASTRWYQGYFSDRLDINGVQLVGVSNYTDPYASLEGEESTGSDYALVTNADLVAESLISNHAYIGTNYFANSTITPSPTIGQYSTTPGTVTIAGILAATNDIKAGANIVVQAGKTTVGKVTSVVTVGGGSGMTTLYSYTASYVSTHVFKLSNGLETVQFTRNYPTGNNMQVVFTFFDNSSAAAFYTNINSNLSSPISMEITANNVYTAVISVTPSSVSNNGLGQVTVIIPYFNFDGSPNDPNSGYYNGPGTTTFYVNPENFWTMRLNSITYAVSNPPVYNAVLSNAIAPSTVATLVNQNGVSVKGSINYYDAATKKYILSSNILAVNDTLYSTPLTSSISFKDSTGANIKAITYNNATGEITYDGLVAPTPTIPNGVFVNDSNRSVYTQIASGGYVASAQIGGVSIGDTAGSYWGGYMVAIGSGAGAMGDSVSIGHGSLAATSDSIAIGRNASTAAITGTYGVAIGSNSTVTNYGGVALGQGTSATGYGVAIGYGATGYYNNSTIVIGNNSYAYGDAAIVIGSSARVNGGVATAMAIGASATVNANWGTAIGYTATVNGSMGLAIGYGSAANGNYSTSIGTYSQSSPNYTTMLGGYNNQVNSGGVGTVVIGGYSSRPAQGGDDVTVINPRNVSDTANSFLGASTNFTPTSYTDSAHVHALSRIINNQSANTYFYIPIGKPANTNAQYIDCSTGVWSSYSTAVAVGTGSSGYYLVADAVLTVIMYDNQATPSWALWDVKFTAGTNGTPYSSVVLRASSSGTYALPTNWNAIEVYASGTAPAYYQLRAKFGSTNYSYTVQVSGHVNGLQSRFN